MRGHLCMLFCSTEDRNIKLGCVYTFCCLPLFLSPVFFAPCVPPLFPRLQLHCYKQSSHCALLLSRERDGGERVMQGVKTNEGEGGLKRNGDSETKAEARRGEVCTVGQMLPRWCGDSHPRELSETRVHEVNHNRYDKLSHCGVSSHCRWKKYASTTYKQIPAHEWISLNEMSLLNTVRLSFHSKKYAVIISLSVCNRPHKLLNVLLWNSCWCPGSRIIRMSCAKYHVYLARGPNDYLAIY